MERSTNGIRNVMFDQIEKFLKGEVTADHLNALKNGFGVILNTVEKDLHAQKMVADLRRGRDQPQCVADLNLNLKLGGSIHLALNEAADTPVAKTVAPPKGPQTTFIGGKSPTLPAP